MENNEEVKKKKFDFTDAQKEVIAINNDNLLVSASAAFEASTLPSIAIYKISLSIRCVTFIFNFPFQKQFL